MKLKICLLVTVLALTAFARGATNDLTGLLQQGLFEEEANRDLTAAITNYQSLATAFDKDRQLAATAIFRLGECYRKLGKTNDAVAQYQRILKEFGDQPTLVTLSRQNLTGLNVAAPTAVAANESSLADAEATVASLQAQLEAIDKMTHDQKAVYVQQNFPNPMLITLMQELFRAQEDLIKLKVDYTPDHPKYKIAQELVDDLKRKADAQLEGTIEGLRTKLAVAQAQLNFLVQRPREGNSIGSGSNVVLARLLIERAQQQIAEDEKTLKDLLQTYLPTNARVIEARQKIVSERASLAEMNAKLQNIQSSGGGSANDGNAITDEEQQEIRRIQLMIQNSPDLINAGSGGTTPLLAAAAKGQLVVANYLLDHGADANQGSGSPKEVPLSVAAAYGQKAMVELLLSRGADVNGGGLSPLYNAVQKGYMGVAEVLLEYHADVNLPSGSFSDKLRPIQAAARDGRTEMVKLLIEHGADVNVADPDGKTALAYAAGNNQTNAAKLLLAAKAAVDTKDKDGNTPLHTTAARGHAGMVSLLLEAGATVDATNNDHATPLLFAIEANRADVVRVMLTHKADPNRIGNFKDSSNGISSWRPVSLAIRNRNNDILKLLLDAGANPEITSIFSAIANDNAEAARLLLDHGTDPNRPDKDGYSPLYRAIRSKALVEVLLDKGADANTKDKWGNPALVFTSDPEIGRLLVEHKADVNSRNSVLGTPLMNAWDTNYIRFLLESGANPDLQDTNGNTALHVTIVFRSIPEIVALLLQYKANPNIQNDLGFTPLDLAKAGQGGSIGNWMYSPEAKSISVNSESEKKMADLLMQAGGLANLPKRNRIEVRRVSQSGVAFTKDSRDWNRYSLLEIIAGEYRLVYQNQFFGAWGSSQDSRYAIWNNDLRFPDFKNVVVYRRTDASSKQKAINVNVEDILNSGDCSRDMWLEWGDVVEIPESDHPVDLRWSGLLNPTLSALTNCLSRQVSIVIKGVSTTLKLHPEFSVLTAASTPDYETVRLGHVSFMLRSVLDNSKLVRVSSDLSRVKVTRVDSETKKKQEWVIDCTNPSQADLWLRDGDVIEVPEK